jgi:predicted nucleotidyltransferase
MDKREDILAKVREFKEQAIEKFPVKIEQVYLFGSYARGTPHRHSDIDVAFVVDHLGEDYVFFKSEPVLWRIGGDIDCRMSPHVIARDMDYAGFLEEIERTGIEV